MKLQIDTIAAQATPVGRCGIGIIRVSGPKAKEIANELLQKKITTRVVNVCKFFAKDKTILDEGIAIFFTNPRSFTGEDVLELHGHGGQVIMDVLLQRVLELGARLARPGEFTERAYFNGKLDLIQAEAVVDLINASTRQAAQSAARSLQGEFSQEINKVMERITELRVQVEADIDFVEEDGVTKLTHNDFFQGISALIKKIGELKKKAEQGIILREGMTVVIAGDTNAGKSSLFNYFSGQETAIVTSYPGTTRDILRAWIQLDGLPINLLDTAGLRDKPDPVEEEGIRRAREEMKKAEHVLFMVDAAESYRKPREVGLSLLGSLAECNHLTILYNKIDLTGEAAKVVNEDGFNCIYLSVKEGQGLDFLKRRLKETGMVCDLEGAFSARRQQIEALGAAAGFLENIENKLLDVSTIDLVAEDLKKAQEVLGEILGGIVPADILNKIFSEFCIGK